MKRLRSSRAMPDLMVYEPCRIYHGLFIELKSDGTRIVLKDGTLTKDTHIREQAKVLKALNKRGYFATFAVGWEQSRAVIDWYMKKELVVNPVADIIMALDEA